MECIKCKNEMTKAKLYMFGGVQIQSETKSILENKPFWVQTRSDEKQLIFNSVQRCLGVAQFVQSLDVPYEELKVYDEYREKLEKLLDK